LRARPDYLVLSVSAKNIGSLSGRYIDQPVCLVGLPNLLACLPSWLACCVSPPAFVLCSLLELLELALVEVDFFANQHALSNLLYLDIYGYYNMYTAYWAFLQSQAFRH
jgi:hypothetical protein